MTTEQIILSADDFRALGGDPENPKSVKTTARLAVLPMALAPTEENLNPGFALSPDALASATPEQVEYLSRLPRRQVAVEEYAWWQAAVDLQRLQG